MVNIIIQNLGLTIFIKFDFLFFFHDVAYINIWRSIKACATLWYCVAKLIVKN